MPSPQSQLPEREVSKNHRKALFCGEEALASPEALDTLTPWDWPPSTAGTKMRTQGPAGSPKSLNPREMMGGEACLNSLITSWLSIKSGTCIEGWGPVMSVSHLQEVGGEESQAHGMEATHAAEFT